MGAHHRAMPKVFITGTGFITSIGNDASTVGDSLRALRHGMVRYAPFDKPEVPVKVAAPVRGFSTDAEDPEDWTLPARYRVRREVLRSLGPGALYAWCAMQQARARSISMPSRWTTARPSRCSSGQRPRRCSSSNPAA